MNLCSDFRNSQQLEENYESERKNERAVTSQMSNGMMASSSPCSSHSNDTSVTYSMETTIDFDTKAKSTFSRSLLREIDGLRKISQLFDASLKHNPLDCNESNGFVAVENIVETLAQYICFQLKRMELLLHRDSRSVLEILTFDPSLKKTLQSSLLSIPQLYTQLDRLQSAMKSQNYEKEWRSCATDIVEKWKNLLRTNNDSEVRSEYKVVFKTFMKSLLNVLNDDFPLTDRLLLVQELVISCDSNSDIYSLYRSFCDSVELLGSSWKNSLSELSQLVSSLLINIRPLNFRQVCDTMDQRSHCDILEMARGIFLTGASGSGKSTLIHVLHGSQFVREIVNGAGDVHYNPIPRDDMKDQLRPFTTSPFDTSETSCILSASVQISGEEVFILDTPGSGDTNGCAIDVANACAIVETMNKCKTFAVVVVISYKAFLDRMLTDDVKDALKSLRNNFRNLDRVNYIITKANCCPESIAERFLSNSKELTNGSDIEVKEILEDISAKLLSSRPSLGRAFALNLSDMVSNPDLLKKTRAELLSYFSEVPIFDCHDQDIETVMTTRSINCLLRQLETMKRRIERGIEGFNVDLVKYNIDFFDALLPKMSTVSAVEAKFKECCRLFQSKYEGHLKSFLVAMKENKKMDECINSLLDDFLFVVLFDSMYLGIDELLKRRYSERFTNNLFFESSAEVWGEGHFGNILEECKLSGGSYSTGLLAEKSLLYFLNTIFNDIKKIGDGKEFSSQLVKSTSELCDELAGFLYKMNNYSDDIRVHFGKLIGVIDDFFDKQISNVIRNAFVQQNISEFGEFLKDGSLFDALIKLDHMEKYAKSFSGLKNVDFLRSEYNRCQAEIFKQLTYWGDSIDKLDLKSLKCSEADHYLKMAKSLRILYEKTTDSKNWFRTDIPKPKATREGISSSSLNSNLVNHFKSPIHLCDLINSFDERIVDWISKLLNDISQLNDSNSSIEKLEFITDKIEVANYLSSIELPCNYFHRDKKPVDVFLKKRFPDSLLSQITAKTNDDDMQSDSFVIREIVKQQVTNVLNPLFYRIKKVVADEISRLFGEVKNFNRRDSDRWNCFCNYTDMEIEKSELLINMRRLMMGSRVDSAYGQEVAALAGSFMDSLYHDYGSALATESIVNIEIVGRANFVSRILEMIVNEFFHSNSSFACRNCESIKSLASSVQNVAVMQTALVDYTSRNIARALDFFENRMTCNFRDMRSNSNDSYISMYISYCKFLNQCIGIKNCFSKRSMSVLPAPKVVQETIDDAYSTMRNRVRYSTEMIEAAVIDEFGSVLNMSESSSRLIESGDILHQIKSPQKIDTLCTLFCYLKDTGNDLYASYKSRIEALSTAFTIALKENNVNVDKINRIMMVCELLSNIDNHIEQSFQFHKLLDKCRSIVNVVEKTLRKSLEILDMRSAIDFISGSSLEEQSIFAREVESVFSNYENCISRELANVKMETTSSKFWIRFFRRISVFNSALHYLASIEYDYVEMEKRVEGMICNETCCGMFYNMPDVCGFDIINSQESFIPSCLRNGDFKSALTQLTDLKLLLNQINISNGSIINVNREVLCLFCGDYVDVTDIDISSCSMEISCYRCHRKSYFSSNSAIGKSLTTLYNQIKIVFETQRNAFADRAEKMITILSNEMNDESNRIDDEFDNYSSDDSDDDYLTSFDTGSLGSQNDCEANFHCRNKWIRRGLRQFMLLLNDLNLISENLGEITLSTLRNNIDKKMNLLESNCFFDYCEDDYLIGNDLSSRLCQFRCSFHRLSRVCCLIPRRALGNVFFERLHKLFDLLEKAEKCVMNAQDKILKTDSIEHLVLFLRADVSNVAVESRLLTKLDEFVSDLTGPYGENYDVFNIQQLNTNVDLTLLLDKLYLEGKWWHEFVDFMDKKLEPTQVVEKYRLSLQKAVEKLMSRVESLFAGQSPTISFFARSNQNFMLKYYRELVLTLRCSEIIRLIHPYDMTATSTLNRVANYVIGLLNHFSLISERFKVFYDEFEAYIPSDLMFLKFEKCDSQRIYSFEKIINESQIFGELVKYFSRLCTRNVFSDEAITNKIKSLTWENLINIDTRRDEMMIRCRCLMSGLLDHHKGVLNSQNRTSIDPLYSVWNFAYTFVKTFDPSYKIEEENLMFAHIDDLGKKWSQQVGEISTSTFQISLYESINVTIENLCSISEQCPDFSKCVNEKKILFLEKLESKIEEILTSSWLNESDWSNWMKYYEHIGDQLCLVLAISSCISICGGKKSAIAEKLIQYRSRTGSGEFMQRLGDYLSVADLEGYASKLLEFKEFSGIVASMRNTQFSQVTVDDVLQSIISLTGTSLTDDVKGSLLGMYNQYQSVYQQTVDLCKLYTRQSIEISRIPSKVFQEVHTKKSSTSAFDTRKAIVNIIAYSFAYWTLQDLEGYNLSPQDPNAKKYLNIPHSGQVIVIFLILGLESSVYDLHSSCGGVGKKGKFKLSLRNYLTEIKTGEGKSIVIAILSTVLALLGYRVDVACYSDYLTERDKYAFDFMFTNFKVKEYIQYDTFVSLCKRLMNAKSVCDDIISLMEGNKVLIDPKYEDMPRVLLVDEVDVLLSELFYGKSFRIFAKLKGSDHPCIKELIFLIWNSRDENLAALWNIVEESVELKNVKEKFPQWKEVIQMTVKTMVSNVKEYLDHQPQVIDSNGVGYFDEDGQRITYEKRDGYRTMFWLMHDISQDKPKITQQMVDDEMNLLIRAGAISYAELPKLYSNTIGVTGTLSTLSEGEKSLLEKGYNIPLSNTAIFPSAYGNYKDNKAVFDGVFAKDIFFEKDLICFYELIVSHAKAYSEQGRPVLVFFPNDTALSNFAQWCSNCDNNDANDVYHRAKTVISQTSPATRKINFDKAVTSGAISLIVASYGRGTDFNYQSTTLDEKGGVHVIQTFFSMETSEQAQIMGRTRRQGHPGSFSMILDLANMNAAGVANPELLDPGTRVYENVFVEARKIESQKRFLARVERATYAKKEHDISDELIHAIYKNDTQTVVQNLFEWNFVNFFSVVSRTVILFDATFSMDKLLSKCKITIKKSVEEVIKLLIAKNLKYGFEIQIVVYRNYSSCGQLCCASPWSSNAEQLNDFLDSVFVSGGCGNEAIEVGFQHVNEEFSKRPDVSHQVILIGDMPANLPGQVINLRQRSTANGLVGEKYWETTRFKTLTTCEKQVNDLAANKIPVFAFYLRHDDGTIPAKEEFSKIVTSTQKDLKDGWKESHELKINDADGVKLLTNTVAMRILKGIQNNVKDEIVDLVKEYRLKYTIDEGFVY